MKTTEKLGLNGRVGDRFEPMLRDALWSSFSSTVKGDARRHLSQSVG